MSDIIRCFAWIPILWGERKEAIPELPFDIIINILTRLPAKCIYKLWQIKKKNHLYAFTTTPSFIRKHLERATKTLVAHSVRLSRGEDEVKLFVFDEIARNVEATSVNLGLPRAISKPTLFLCGSCDGFLLFKTIEIRQLPVLCIWNPVTKEKLIVESPRELFYVCGLYFHPRKKEYEVVSVYFSGERSYFQILNLRNNHRRSAGSCSYFPDYKKPHLLMNETLYWMVDIFMYKMRNKDYPGYLHSILTFNVETEELSSMGTTKPFDEMAVYFHEQFQVFEMEGDLCLFDSSSFIELVIWVFNCTTKCWVKMQSVAKPDDRHHWGFHWYFKEEVQVKRKSMYIHRQEDKQLIDWNLRSGTWKLAWKGFDGNDFWVVHTHSLVSLDAADTLIELKR